VKEQVDLPFGERVSGDEKIGFTGKELDPNGLMYYGARYYDPLTGRFITSDDATDGVNWYAYVANNPMKFVDPDGRFKITINRENFVKYVEETLRGEALHRDVSEVFWRVVRLGKEDLKTIFTPGEGPVIQLDPIEDMDPRYPRYWYYTDTEFYRPIPHRGFYETYIGINSALVNDYDDLKERYLSAHKKDKYIYEEDLMALEYIIKREIYRNIAKYGYWTNKYKIPAKRISEYGYHPDNLFIGDEERVVDEIEKRLWAKDEEAMGDIPGVCSWYEPETALKLTKLDQRRTISSRSRLQSRWGRLFDPDFDYPTTGGD